MNEQETIADIIAEMRGMGNYQRYSGDHARVLANRLDAAHRREVATTKESLAVGNSGDSAKLREAVGYILKYADSVACRDHDEHTRHYIDQIRKWAQSALAEPPRNCDVGSPEEQAKRFDEFCVEHHRKMIGNKIPTGPCECPCYEGNSCNYFVWAQMPYEEGGAK